jgi:DNA modification methylase
MTDVQSRQNAPKPPQVEITAPKGRPMLSWVGKKPLRYLPALPAQHVEAFDPSGDLAKIKPRSTWLDWPAAYPKTGLLFHGDNKEILANLLAAGFRGRVNCVYIDPPYDSGADYVRKVELRGVAGSTKIAGEQYSLGEQLQYTDIWNNDGYLQFMYERLILIRELLSESGNLFVHCDDTRNYVIRAIIEELFPSNFRNEIIWKRSTSTGLAKKRCGTLHDTIYWYSKSPQYTFNMQYHDYEAKYLKRAVKDSDGREYIPIPTGNPGPRPNLYYAYKGYWPHPNGYKWTPEKMAEFDRDDRLIFPEDKNGRIQYKQYLDEMEGVKLQDLWTDIPAKCQDLWTDIPAVNPVANERLGYPTQKPETLIERILQMASNEGDIVLDCFVGSGTTCAVAQKIGRRWIGCDLNKGAIQTTAKRLQQVIEEQLAAPAAQPALIDEPADAPPPCQLSISIFRVNDYDLQIQHNEAVRLASEYIGVETNRSDAYFDGTLGKSLAKIIPFNHPLSPLDLDDLKRELEARKTEDRDVTLICLGLDVAAQGWIEEWNRLRKKSNNVPNRIRVIELRTDPTYSGFLKHEPASAKIKIARSPDKAAVTVTIEDFISPTIVKRLNLEADLFQKKIKDWRSMVDSVMIDRAYDGKVFNVTLWDLPEKKTDLVAGNYEVPAPSGSETTTVAVKIVDMLGEEVLLTKEV